MFKKMIQIVILVSLVFAVFMTTGKAEAWSGCGDSYYVQWGDTLYNIALKCGTTMDAIRQANPGVYNWVYAGQVLRMPDGNWHQPGGPGGYHPAPNNPSPSGYTYVIQCGDTLRKLADRWGVTIWDILAINRQITNASIIYVGQVINVPVQSAAYATIGSYNNPGYYTVQRGDTLRIIANRYGTTVYNLVALNPQIANPNWIYAGMVIRVQ